MPMASLSRWTMGYFAAALAFLLVAEGLAAAGLGDPAPGWSEPGTLILVHLVAIGWLSLAMAGALLQFVPVLAARPLALPQLALPALVAIVAGLILVCSGFASLAGWFALPLLLLPLGGLALLGGFALLVVMLAGTLAGLRPGDAFAGFIRAGLLCLALAVVSGAAFATILSGEGAALGPIARLLPGGTRFHALLGLGGWLGLIAAGVSYRLFAMFMLAPEPPARRLRLLLVIAGAGLALAAAGLAAPLAGWEASPALAPAAAAGLAVAAGLYGRDMLALLRARRRKALELNMRASLPAFAALGVGILALPPVLLPGAEEPLAAAAAFLLVMGWLGGLTLAQMTKIVPFLTWLEAYAPRLGKGPAPLVKDLLAARRCAGWLALYGAGVTLAAIALAGGGATGFRLAMLPSLVGTAGIAAELVRVRRLSEVKAPGRPPPHECPRLLLARTDERSLSDAHPVPSRSRNAPAPRA